MSKNSRSFGPESIDCIYDLGLTQVFPVTFKSGDLELQERNKAESGSIETIDLKGQTVAKRKSEGLFERIARFLPKRLDTILSCISILVAWAGISIPIQENNRLLERVQADKIYAYPVRGNNGCDNDQEVSSLKEENDDWRICLANASDAPIYEVVVKAKRTDASVAQYNDRVFSHSPSVEAAVEIFQILPGEKANAWEMNLDVEYINLSDDGVSYAKLLSQETVKIEFSYHFKDNNGIFWNGQYELNNLQEGGGLNFIQVKPLTQGRVPEGG